LNTSFIRLFHFTLLRTEYSPLEPKHTRSDKLISQFSRSMDS
jgi:hypothetical protein